MAETKKTPKQHTLTAASPDSPAPGSTPVGQAAPPKGNATGLRVGAIVLWVVAIALEVLALLIFNGTLFKASSLKWPLGIGALVLDLVCVIIGSQLWKKANHISPASKANKVKFWLWNNLGVLVSIVAFAPFVVLLLTDKNADIKTKKIASIVAVVALVIAGILSYDPNPISSEELSAAMDAYNGVTVYWTKSGKVYHSHQDCFHLDRTDDLTYGSVDQAVAANRVRLCKTCQKKDEEAGVDLSGVLTEEGNDDVDTDIDAEDVNDVDSIPDAA